ncbi:MAG: hypothetical protein BGP09_31215 [Rhizobium sp. 60-20]|nr:MAG: hypothetical protein BGP09_31215 [Rhizobium sp. 60-20]
MPSCFLRGSEASEVLNLGRLSDRRGGFERVEATEINDLLCYGDANPPFSDISAKAYTSYTCAIVSSPVPVL